MAKMNRMSYWTTYSMLGIMVTVLIVFVVFIFKHDQMVSEGMVDPSGSNSAGHLATGKAGGPKVFTVDDEWNVIYPNTRPMEIADVTVSASIAETWTERISGLSGTPYLPEFVVKLFIFDSSGFHSIWMKDMNYPLDVIWVDENKVIVDIEEDISPDSFPESFVPDLPAHYVIEATAGFVTDNDIEVGDQVTLPNTR